MRFRLGTLLLLITLACTLIATLCGLWRFAEEIDALFKG
jgi:hypothetical protein